MYKLNMTARSKNFTALKNMAITTTAHEEPGTFSYAENGRVTHKSEVTLQDLRDNGKMPTILFDRIADYFSKTYPDWKDPMKEATLEYLRDDMLIDMGLIVGGIFTHPKLYDLLIEYCGDTILTRLAIGNNIRLHKATDGYACWEAMEKKYATVLPELYDTM